MAVPNRSGDLENPPTSPPPKLCACCKAAPRIKGSYCDACRRDKVRAWSAANVKRRMWLDLKNNAKVRGIPFDLPFESIVWPERCPVFGTLLDYSRGSGWKDERVTPAFDRMDPAKGYVEDNVWIISGRANRIKTDATSAELRITADYMDKHARSK